MRRTYDVSIYFCIYNKIALITYDTSQFDEITGTFFKPSYRRSEIYVAADIFHPDRKIETRRKRRDARFDRTLPKVSYTGEVPSINNGTVLRACVHALSYTLVRVTLAIWSGQTSAE